jgi:hypothetical protein
MKLKKFTQFLINESEDNETNKSDLSNDINDLIQKTIDNSGGEFSSFVDSLIKYPDDSKIEGLINDSDIYDFYLKHRTDIDDVLTEIRFFDEVPTDLNVYGLYDYIIIGTKKAIEEVVKNIK